MFDMTDALERTAIEPDTALIANIETALSIGIGIKVTRLYDKTRKLGCEIVVEKHGVNRIYVGIEPNFRFQRVAAINSIDYNAAKLCCTKRAAEQQQDETNSGHGLSLA